MFSAKAKDAMHQALVSFGEFLPLFCKDGEFFLFKPLLYIDALDKTKSVIEWSPYPSKDTKSRMAVRIKKYEFSEEKLTGVQIFRIPERPAFDFYVTELFENCLSDNKLIGLDLKLIYPIDPNSERQKMLEKYKRRRGKYK